MLWAGVLALGVALRPPDMHLQSSPPLRLRWHTLELKALTIGLGVIGVACTMYQYAYQRTFWEMAGAWRSFLLSQHGSPRQELAKGSNSSTSGASWQACAVLGRPGQGHEWAMAASCRAAWLPVWGHARSPLTAARGHSLLSPDRS